MKIKHRYKIEPLPVIPNGSQFIINGRYAKVENDILHLWYKVNNVWNSTNQTLAEYNDYWVPESHEYGLSQIMYMELSCFSAYRHGFKYGGCDNVKYCIFKDWDDEYKISLYQAKPKGFKGVEKNPRYSGGASVTIRKNLYPQLDELVGDQILMVKPNGNGIM